MDTLVVDRASMKTSALGLLQIKTRPICSFNVE